MNILITGGAGFIGSNACEYFLNKGEKVTILDNFSRKGSRNNVDWLKKNFHRGLRIIEADVRYDPLTIYKEVERADSVIHLAGQVAVTTSVQKPREDFEINALGTLNLLEAVRVSKSKPIFINASTNKVYGKMDNVRVKELKTRYYYRDYPNGIGEDFPVDFHSPYGCSKGAADQYTKDYARIYGLDTVVFRQSCIYGPRQYGIEDQGWVAWFLIAGMIGLPITIYGDGKQVRDLLYVTDLVRAYDLAIQKIKNARGNVYNVGGGSKNSMSIWHEFEPHIKSNLNKDVKVSFSDWRPGDQKVFVTDTTKAKNYLKWSPETSITDGISRLATWLKDNKEIVTKEFS